MFKIIFIFVNLLKKYNHSIPKLNNKHAVFWAKNYLLSKDGNIEKILFAIFSFNGAGNNWESLHNNLLPLVIFAYMESLLNPQVPIKTTGEYEHFLTQFSSLVDKLEYLAETNPAKNVFYTVEFYRAGNLLKGIESNPPFTRLPDIYKLILDNWDDLKDWCITYRLLADLAIIYKSWTNTFSKKLELLTILSNVTNEWDN